MYKLLIVDDEERIRTLIKKYALLEGIAFPRRATGWRRCVFANQKALIS